MSGAARPRALVTGASSGIGLAFARRLAAEGHAVLAVARREAELRALAEGLPGEGHDFLVADLGTDEGVARVGEAMAREHVTLLVNNAGLSVFEPFWRSPHAVQMNLLAVNCGAMTSLAHHFLRHSREGDALINLASVVAWLPTPAQPVYSASKAFVASLSECLWEEHRGRGVYVMGLCPGITRTGFIRHASGGAADGSELPAALVQTPEAVVEEAMTALRRRERAIVVTGGANRWMLRFARLLSRHRLLKLLAVAGDPARAL